MMNSRKLLSVLILGITSLLSVGCAAENADQAPAPVDTSHYSQDPQESFDRLVDGNKRMVVGDFQNVDLPVELLTARATGQKPYAAIMACADSRSSPEILFDAGYSELFVCRVAGNIADAQGRASVEYAVKVLGTRLIVVMGHTQCGAVDATLKKLAISANIVSLVAEIQPGVQVAREENWPKDDLLARGVVVNAYMQKTRLLKFSDMLRSEHAAGRVRIVVGVQDLATGKVTWLDNDGLNGPAKPSEKLYASPDSAVLEKHAVK